jgi:hypothetical protein
LLVSFRFAPSDTAQAHAANALGRIRLVVSLRSNDGLVAEQNNLRLQSREAATNFLSSAQKLPTDRRLLRPKTQNNTFRDIIILDCSFVQTSLHRTEAQATRIADLAGGVASYARIYYWKIRHRQKYISTKLNFGK